MNGTADSLESYGPIKKASIWFDEQKKISAIFLSFYFFISHRNVPEKICSIYFSGAIGPIFCVGFMIGRQSFHLFGGGGGGFRPRWRSLAARVGC